MRGLGIDYGVKKVGLALSDESGSLAFPHSIVETSKVIETVKEIVAAEDVDFIVLGHSSDMKGKDNPVMTEIAKFKTSLEDEIEQELVYEPEMYTTVAARRIPGDKRGENLSKEAVDDKAAALLLQSYLDRKNV